MESDAGTVTVTQAVVLLIKNESNLQSRKKCLIRPAIRYGDKMNFHCRSCLELCIFILLCFLQFGFF